MIKKLQRKFILITMLSLLLIMVIIVGFINGINLYQLEKNSNMNIDQIAENQGRMPDFKPEENHKEFRDMPKNPEAPYITRYFVVMVNLDNTIGQIDTSHIKAISALDARTYAEQVIGSKHDSGYMDQNYKYKVVNQANGKMIVFLDCYENWQMIYRIFGISCMVSLATLILMFILVSVLSRRAIKPIIESSEKQKLFITDAGHEIKTPLAIISANTDVLELTGGENEWITSIRHQVTRLDKLVKNLLVLSKLEEGQHAVSFQDVDYSEVVMRTAKAFIAVAETQNKKYIISIHPGIRLLGDESSLEQLISTLLDNAMKYSDLEGLIQITLTSSKKGARLEVYNTTASIEVGRLDHLFDRFYRSDSSRSRETGGYGIGLSIAKSIVEAHHGKISAHSADGKSILFTLVL